MNTQLSPPVLNLLSRHSARERTLRPGASVWYREDVRLADGASRVVPGVFQKYDRRGVRCAVVMSRTDDGLGRGVFVAVDDVFPRHWADDVLDDRPRIAWAPPPVEPIDVGPASTLVAIVFLVLCVGLAFGAFYLWSRTQ